MAKRCPNTMCNDQGYTAEYRSFPDYVMDEMGNEHEVETAKWVQIQCEFCWTDPESVFNKELKASGKL